VTEPAQAHVDGGRAPTRLAAAALVLTAGMAFATSSPLGRWARPADPLVVAFGRLALAAVALVLFDARGIAASVRALTPKQRLTVAAGGALLGAHFACFQWGLDHTSLAAAASLVSLEPVSVVVVAWVLFKLRPSREELIAIGVATLGALLVGSAAGEGEHRVIGDAGVIAAVVLFGLYLAVARAVPKTLPTRSYVALVYASAAVTVGLALPWSASSRPPGAFDLPVHAVAAIALLALVPTIVGHTVLQAAARVLPPSLVSLASPLETVGSIAIGAAVLGEMPTSRETAGSALVLVGTTLALVAKRAR
jgi:drug/metabolite transporter (DMT)-like permease